VTYIADCARCSGVELCASFMASFSESLQVTVGGAPPCLILPDVHVDWELKSLEVRIQEATWKLLRGARAKKMTADPLQPTNEIIASIRTALVQMVNVSFSTFEPSRAIPCYPLPAGSTYVMMHGCLTISYKDRSGRTVWVRCLWDDYRLLHNRRLLVVVSDQGSPMFAAALYLVVVGLLAIYVPDPNHIDNNDLVDANLIAGLAELKAKTGFLCKFNAGPYAAKGAGGKFKKQQQEVWNAALDKLWDESSEVARLLDDYMPFIARDISVIVGTRHAKAAVVSFINRLAQVQG